MKKHAASTGLILLEVFAVLVAVTAAGAAFLYWRLDRGPVSLDLFKPSAEFAIERRLPKGYSANIGDLRLGRSKERSDFVLTISELTISDPNGGEAATAPEIAFAFSLRALLSGEAGLKTIAASGAKFRIVRNERQNVEIIDPKKEDDDGDSNVLSGLLEGQFLKSAFASADLSNAEITFVDVASGRSWIAPDANVRIERNEYGLSGTLSGDIDMGDAAASLSVDAQYLEGEGVISVVAEGDNFPIGDILTMFYGENAAVLDAPVSGKALISMTKEGDVISSSFSARAGEGTLLAAGVRKPVTFIEWETDFDPDANEFTIDRFGFDVDGSTGVVRGAVAISFGDDIRKPEDVRFDLKSEDLVIDTKDFLPEPVPVPSVDFSGDYNLVERKLTIQAIDLKFLDVGVAGNFALTFPEHGSSESIGVDAALKVDGSLDKERLLKIWPFRIANGAREWIAERIDTMKVDNLKFDMALPVGGIGEEGGLPDDSMTLTFNVSNAKAHYIVGMTPVTEGVGSGVLKGNSFKLKVASAKVGDIPVIEGEVDFPVFIPKHEPTYIRFSTKGRSDKLLALIDQAPLSLLSKINLDPNNFSGDAKAKVEIMRPNKTDVLPEEYQYDGEASFENMTIEGLFNDLVLTGANGKIMLETTHMVVDGRAMLDDSPIKFNWDQQFFGDKPGNDPSKLLVSGEVESSTGAFFGLTSRQYLNGPVAIEAKGVGDIGNFDTLDIDADFTKANINLIALGWEKPSGIPAQGKLNVKYDKNGASKNIIDFTGEPVRLVREPAQNEITQIDVLNTAAIVPAPENDCSETEPEVRINGTLDLSADGYLQAINFNKVCLEDAARFSVKAEREITGALSIEVVGDTYTAGPLIESFLGGSSGNDEDNEINWGEGVSISARIDNLKLREGVMYKVASLDFWRDANRLQELNFSAFSDKNQPLTVNLAVSGEETGSAGAVEARTSEIHNLLKGVLGVKSIDAGEGTLRVNLSAPGEKGIDGVLEARNLHVREAPLLARIFAVGSLDGLGRLLSGEGINFTYAYGKFDLKDSILSIENARATGPSVGLTASGAVAMGKGSEISLSGAIAPIYQLNAMLGNTPVIGDILVGKKGEGILALSYSATGQAGSPNITVNPLSALTPGVFRALVQPPRDDAENLREEMEVPDEAPTTEEPSDEEAVSNEG